MAWLICALGVALALAGAASLANGIPYIRLDWGQAETVAGTVAVSGGLVTAALGAVIFALRGDARRSAGPRAADLAREEVASLPAEVRPEPSFAPPPRDAAPPTRAEPPRNAPALAPAEAAPPVEAPTVVGRYERNGASYVLFSDGTIEVETESGTHRFASMDALKDHIERQGAA